MSKVMSIRIDTDQVDKLSNLSKQLRNSDAGVIRLGIDLLHENLVQKGALVIPPAHVNAPKPQAGAARRAKRDLAPA
jgi:hypothetical protein